MKSIISLGASRVEIKRQVIIVPEVDSRCRVCTEWARDSVTDIW